MIAAMREPPPVNRYTLVPRAQRAGANGSVRRYSLARIAVSPRSALGEDRHERLERVADMDVRRA